MKIYGALLLITLLAACTPKQQPFAAEHAHGAGTIRLDRFTAADGTTLPLRIWMPEGKISAIIIALHGFNDYSNAFALPAPALNERGIAVFAYDQRGFGQAAFPGIWAGEDNLVTDLRQLTVFVRTYYPFTPTYILGESMGGAVAIAAVTREDFPKIDGLILSSPALWGEETMHPLYRAALWSVSHTLPYKEFTGAGLKILASDNIPMLQALGRDPLVLKTTRADAIYGLVQLMDHAYIQSAHLEAMPVLLLYGGKDQVIPPLPINLARARLPQDTRYIFYPNGYHLLLRGLEAGRVLTDISDWVLQNGHGTPFIPEPRIATRQNNP